MGFLWGGSALLSVDGDPPWLWSAQPPRACSGERGRRGFTLMETVISTVVLSLLVVAGLNAAGALGQARRSLGDRALAQGMAQSLLAEVVAMPYEDAQDKTEALGLEPGENVERSSWDDVDDSNGLMESPPLDAAGNPISDEPGWERTVLVEWVELSGGEIKDVGGESGLKRVTVSVRRGGRLLAEAIALRSEGWDAAKP
jgi:prepilin-type N-terminal cleavage/methylation domain-containing protein